MLQLSFSRTLCAGDGRSDSGGRAPGHRPEDAAGRFLLLACCGQGVPAAQAGGAGVRGVRGAVPGHPASAGRVHGDVSRHHRQRIGLSARGGQGSAPVQCGGGHPVAQPSQRRSRAQCGRSGADPAAQGCAGAGGRAHPGSRHRCGSEYGILCRARADLTSGASVPCLIMFALRDTAPCHRSRRSPCSPGTCPVRSACRPAGLRTSCP